MQLTKQEISDLTLSCETLMAQLYDDIKPIESHFDDDIDNIELKERYYRIWDLRDKLNK